MDEIKKAITKFWERIEGTYESVEMNEVSLKVKRKINEYRDEEISRDEITKFVKTTLLHKGGHKSKKELKNYRPIALADTIAKVFCGGLSGRLSECSERCKVLGEEQNGFRKD
ncbi:MAG: hypothetical protein DSY42_03580 [Aquifex sp.]|nr:MAG: hypothetical protein DSY42_03580 [Aquifex sp.]